MSELANASAVRIRGENFGGHGKAGAREGKGAAVGADVEFFVEISVHDYFWDVSGRGRDRIDRHFAFVFGGEINGLAVGHELVGLDAAVESFRQIGFFLVFTRIKHKAPAIGFIARLRLRAIGDPLAVTGIYRAPIVGGIQRDSRGSSGAGDGKGKKIPIGAGRLVSTGVGGEANFAAVGRKSNRFRGAQ